MKPRKFRSVIAGVLVSAGLSAATPVGAATSSVSLTLPSGAAVAAMSCVPGGTCVVATNLVGPVTPWSSGPFGGGVEITLTSMTSTGQVQLGQSEEVLGTGYDVEALQCFTATSCIAAGHFAGADGTARAFVASELGGVWSPEFLPGIPAAAPYSPAVQLSCVGPRLCGLVVSNINADLSSSTFSVVMVNGVWQAPRNLPLNPGQTGSHEVAGVSCWAGGCTFVGDFYSVDTTDTYLAGTKRWTSALGSGNTSVNAVSCQSDGTCLVVGVGTLAILHDGIVKSVHAMPTPPGAEAVWGLWLPGDRASCLSVPDVCVVDAVAPFRTHNGMQTLQATATIVTNLRQANPRIGVPVLVDPGVATSSIGAVTCSSVRRGFACGVSGNGSKQMNGGGWMPFFTTFDGHKWQRQWGGAPPTSQRLIDTSSLIAGTTDARGRVLFAAYCSLIDGINSSSSGYYINYLKTVTVAPSTL